MQPRKPRRTETLSSDTPPTIRLLILNPGSWFPICTVSCAKRGAACTIWKRLAGKNLLKG